MLKALHAARTTPPRQPLGLEAYEQICRGIITLAYQPGTMLDEKQLMAELHLGRTPIREAILRLAGEGWLETQPNRGAMVPPITLQKARAVFEAMRVLELGVATLAVGQKIDEQLVAMRVAGDEVRAAIAAGDILGLVDANHTFHVAYADCARNEFLSRACLEVRNQAKRLAYLSYANEIDRNRSLHGHYQAVNDEHQAIIDCLINRDEARLKEIITSHINTFQGRIVAYMSS
jgi:DNA-binding GntR family transcriptional regulator